MTKHGHSELVPNKKKCFAKKHDVSYSDTLSRFKTVSVETTLSWTDTIENVFINTKTPPFMYVAMITFLCPFLLESKIEDKIAMKTRYTQSYLFNCFDT